MAVVKAVIITPQSVFQEGLLVTLRGRWRRRFLERSPEHLFHASPRGMRLCPNVVINTQYSGKVCLFAYIGTMGGQNAQESPEMCDACLSHCAMNDRSGLLWDWERKIHFSQDSLGTSAQGELLQLAAAEPQPLQSVHGWQPKRQLKIPLTIWVLNESEWQESEGEWNAK